MTCLFADTSGLLLCHPHGVPRRFQVAPKVNCPRARQGFLFIRAAAGYRCVRSANRAGCRMVVGFRFTARPCRRSVRNVDSTHLRQHRLSPGPCMPTRTRLRSIHGEHAGMPLCSSPSRYPTDRIVHHKVGCRGAIFSIDGTTNGLRSQERLLWT